MEKALTQKSQSPGLSRDEKSGQSEINKTETGAPASAPNRPNEAKPAGGVSTPMARPARIRKRHRRVVISFLTLVVAPVLVSAWYLFAMAKDQYASYVAFAVRSEDVSSAVDLLGGLGSFGSSGSEDADILYEFIQSRELVALIDKELDLRKVYSEDYSADPVFSYDGEGTIEDLTDYWARMVKIFYDSGTGLIELRVHAFTPADAQRIAASIFDSSSALINDLSATARDDATRYTREELDRAVERLKVARQAVTEYRSRNQMVDPEAEIGAQTGMMTALQTKLSDALIAYDLLIESASTNDPRLAQAERRIEVIQQRIKEERLKFGFNDDGDIDYPTLVGEYERLAVDREFAEQTYLAALAAHDAALTEAQRKSKYLAAYIKPTLAERAEYPERGLLLVLIGLFLFFSWAIATLIYYAIKDRR